MINTSQVASYRKFLNDRIEELTKTHARYKEVEADHSNDELHRMGLNSSAACIWDAKCALEQCMETFNMEFSADSLPYNLTHLQIGPYASPKITFKIAEEEITIDMEKIKDERGEETLNRLVAKADKYWEFEIQEEVAKIELMRSGTRDITEPAAGKEYTLAESLSDIDNTFAQRKEEREKTIREVIKAAFNGL